MSRQTLPTTMIDQQPGLRWTAMVHFLECQHIQHNKNNDPYKRILLTDADGIKLTALIFTNHLNRYRNTFRQYRRYYISNAFVIKNRPIYSVSPYQYSWVLNNRTLVEELTDPRPPILPCKFYFTHFSKLYKYADSQNFLDVRGIVLQCLPSYDHGDQVTRRDIIIVNEEKILLAITLWNQFDEHEGNMLQAMIESAPLIFGLRLKMTTFNSVSLTTTPSSAILINPPISKDLQLRDWYNTNRTEIQELLQTINFRNNDFILPYPDDRDITSIIKVVDSFENSKTAWISGKLSLPVQERGFSYTGCATCHKALEADITWIVTCPSCRVESEIIAMT